VLYILLVRESTLDSQIFVIYLIKHKQFEFGVDLPPTRKIACFFYFQVKGNKAFPLPLFVSFRVKTQPPGNKKNDHLRKSLIITEESGIGQRKVVLFDFCLQK